MYEKGQDGFCDWCQPRGYDSRHHYGWVDQSGQLSWASSSWLRIPVDVFQSNWLYLSTQGTDLFPWVRYARRPVCQNACSTDLLAWLHLRTTCTASREINREPHLLRFWLTGFQTREEIFCCCERAPFVTTMINQDWRPLSLLTFTALSGSQVQQHLHQLGSYAKCSLCINLLFNKACRWFVCMLMFEKPHSPMACGTIST